uniref:26S proteasome non-ATPase regulatory subunit 2 homolog n=1 Tax=Compsopogon caeruleus TaxID=31354 RepID=A0A6T6B035_9RHOD
MDPDAGVQKIALETIRSELRSATASMTSVPKPLKFLRVHYPSLKEFFLSSGKMEEGNPNREFMADVLSVLAMTMAEEGTRESLKFKLMGTKEAPHLWGHEYVRSLCGEIGQEFIARTVEPMENTEGGMADESDTADLSALVDEIVPFLISNNAESEACDLLMDVEAVNKMIYFVDENNYERVCLYLLSCSSFVPEPEDKEMLNVAYEIYLKMNKLPQAMRVAMRLCDPLLVKQTWDLSAGLIEREQLALDLGRQNFTFDVEPDFEEILSNTKLTEYYHVLAKDLEVLEPKHPDDIYKSHLLDTRMAVPSNADSAKQTLASTFVSAFVNLGFATDKLLADEKLRWIYRNKDHGMMSAAASIGMLHLWDVDGGLCRLDKHTYASEDYVRAGALFAVGIVSAGVKSEYDPALPLLSEHVESQSPEIRVGAIAGLGIAYAGTCREDVLSHLMPIVADSNAPADAVSFAALSLGLVFVGSANEDISATLVQMMFERNQDSTTPYDSLVARLVPLALGLLFLGKEEVADAISETVRAMIEGPLGATCTVILESCAYAGSGNVLKIQKLLAICGEHPDLKHDEDLETDGKEKQGDENEVESNQAPPPNGSDEVPPEQAPANDAVDEEMPVDAMEVTNDDQLESSPEDPKRRIEFAAAQQGIATIGLALVAMGEELGSEMVLRAFDHLLQYGDPIVRRAVPLAIGMLSISNPRITVMDSLSKLTHDSDPEVSQAAILGIGLIGAGTNNSRAALLLRQLSSSYSQEAAHLFVVRIAQGLLHAGKGLVTFDPFHSDRFLLNLPALSGLLVVMIAALDMKGTILKKTHFLLFYLALAVKPRMVYCVDENLEPLAVTVRVGTAVDTVGQAGRPKTITGFQTHTSPVLLGAKERAELATDEYIPLSAVFEGVVILRKNPSYVPPESTK